MDTTPIILLHGLGGLLGNSFTRLSLYPLSKKSLSNIVSVQLLEETLLTK